MDKETMRAMEDLADTIAGDIMDSYTDSCIYLDPDYESDSMRSMVRRRLADRHVLSLSMLRPCVRIELDDELFGDTLYVEIIYPDGTRIDRSVRLGATDEDDSPEGGDD